MLFALMQDSQISQHLLYMLVGLLIIVLAVARDDVQADDVKVWKPVRAGTTDPLRLQDFCVFRHDGYTYCASMKKDFCNEGIIVARSRDLMNWEVLGDAVSKRTAEDSAMVWAPHVVQDKGVFHMFYTGVTQLKPGHLCQRILVASTKDPSKPESWQRNSDVTFIVDDEVQNWFRPSHPGTVWSDGVWADCRDPMVLKHGRKWYMFYSGTDQTGGITGVASADNILGPWKDHGAVMQVSAGIPESCFVLKTPNNGFLMVFNHAAPEPHRGIKTARAKSLLPIDGKPSFTDIRLLSDTTGTALAGWAHEFLPDDGKGITTAYLTGYWVNLERAAFRRESFGWTLNAVPGK